MSPFKKIYLLGEDKSTMIYSIGDLSRSRQFLFILQTM